MALSIIASVAPTPWGKKKTILNTVSSILNVALFELF